MTGHLMMGGQQGWLLPLAGAMMTRTASVAPGVNSQLLPLAGAMMTVAACAVARSCAMLLPLAGAMMTLRAAHRSLRRKRVAAPRRGDDDLNIRRHATP